MNKEEVLSRHLHYQFQQPQLLTAALTHRSSQHENNERLEFLGDSIVNCVIAESLFMRYPRAQEGELSRWRATLINRETLATLARGFELGRYMHLGQGELKSGGTERQSILSCAMEAVIGAIYLDGGFETVKECILRWYEPLFENLAQATSLKDPKTALQEYLQGARKPLPIYRVVEVRGEAHQQVFVVSCEVEGIEENAQGTGTSRRRAEQSAAEAMLGILKQ